MELRVVKPERTVFFFVQLDNVIWSVEKIAHLLE